MRFNPAPTGWTREHVSSDSSWIEQLTAEEIEGFQSALSAARHSGKDFLSMQPEDFPLPAASLAVLKRALKKTQGRWGFCLLKGFPVDQWTEAETRLIYWGLGLHMGVARPQNKNSDFLTDVRDAGGEYYGKNGRGYNTNASLDFHIDFGDVVSLLCRRTAMRGGESLITSSEAIYAEVASIRPDLVEVMHQPLYFSWQGAGGKTDRAYHSCTPAGYKDGHFAFRFNLKNILAAQRDFADVPRLTTQQLALIDLLENLFPDPRFCYAMRLEQGDMQLVNNYHVIHSRTRFEDFDEEDKKRHLIRLWLAIPGCQPLPDEWIEPYKCTLANAVRGGLRGPSINEAFVAFEKRQATFHAMNNAYYDLHPH
jgi:hypothetical protein